MKKQKKTAEQKFVFKPSTLQVLSALMSEHQWLDFLLNRYKDYAGLIEHIHELAVRDEYDRLSIKKIATVTGLTSALITRVLHNLYNDLYTLNEEQPDAFQKPGTRYDLHFVGGFDNDSAIFTLWLDHHLHQGDSFEWMFLRAKLQAHQFYVDRISHDYGFGEHRVRASLREGQYNLYRKMLYDQACMNDVIGIQERHRLTDHQLEQLLIHRVVENREGYPPSLSYLEARKYKW